MNQKAVAKYLKSKFWDWANSLPENLRDAVAKDAIITGGCITSLLLGEKVNDYDIYLRTKETLLAVVEHYISEFNSTSRVVMGATDSKIQIYTKEEKDGRIKIVVKSAGVASEGEQNGYRYFESRPEGEETEYIDEIMTNLERAENALAQAVKVNDEQPMEGKPYRPIFLTSNAITLAGHVQIVIRFYGAPRDIHRNFDYVHCTNYWTLEHGLYLNRKAVVSILTKQLEYYTGSKYPICSLFRLRKFIGRGWHITAGQILKIALQVSELDLSRVDVMEDQLIGVDVAYFEELIDKLKDKDPEKVDRGYLIELIEELFEE